eukprot:Hpha_TRINITY_DN16400_c2_g2::TRINITY_DN16400_c2_g2_i7::g.160092::m.160092
MKAWWDGVWKVGEQDLPDSAELSLRRGTFMLKQVTPLLWYLEKALERLAVAGAGAAGGAHGRLYRGLEGVKLDPDTYAAGRVILWAQFSSSSADMSVAQGFTSGTAVIFTIVAPSVPCIAQGSRFQREREYLFPSNSRFVVERSLGEEFAKLLGMNMQLFELRAVSWRQAVAIRIRSAMAAVSGEDAAGRVGSLFEVSRALEDPSLEAGEACRILLCHRRGIPSAPEAAAHLPVLCAMAGL